MDVEFVLFGNDLKLYDSISTTHGVYLLNSNLNGLVDWCIGNDDILNTLSVKQ